MKQSELKKLIKEAIADRIKMIDEAGDIAALEAKIKKVDEDIKDAMSVKTALTSMDGLKYYVSSEIIGDMMDDMEASIKELQTKKKDLEDQKKTMDKNSKGPKKSEKKELDEAKKINEGLSSEIMGPLTDLAKSMNIPVGELIGQIAAAAGTVGGIGAAIGSAYRSYKKGLPKGDDKKMEEARFEKGEDVGKPGKGFAKIAKSAAKKYGSKEAGQKVAGAILKKVVKK